MQLLRTIHAIFRLKVVDTALAANSWWEQRRGITAETPTYQRLNAAVAYADSDPNLPDRYRDPRDL